MKLLCLLAFVAATAISCGGSSKPDRVVGVVLKCTSAGNFELSEEECNNKYASGSQAGQYTRFNRRLVITVKPASGAAYIAELPPDTAVAVGDRWPR